MPELPDRDRHNPADPRRWVRRHHYQEGPGFLFVATQGGRPAGDPIRPAHLQRVRRRMQAVRVARQIGVDAARGQLGCGRSALYEWLAAFEAEGIVGLLEASKRPRHLRPSIPGWVDHVILTIRFTYWNSKRISAEMAPRQIYRVGHDYIDRLLRLHRRLLLSAETSRQWRPERTRENARSLARRGPRARDLVERQVIAAGEPRPGAHGGHLQGTCGQTSRPATGKAARRARSPDRAAPASFKKGVR